MSVDPERLKSLRELGIRNPVFRPVVKQPAAAEPLPQAFELSEDDQKSLLLGRALRMSTKGTVLGALVQKQDAPVIHVHADHTVAEGAVQVTNTPPAVTIERGAVQNIYEQPGAEGDVKVTYDAMGRVTGVRRI